MTMPKIFVCLALLAASVMGADTQQAEILQPVKQVPSTDFDAPPGTWTLVVLPDTQYYAKTHPDVFTRQTEWIVRNREAHNILFVAHEGDVTAGNLPEQWQVARDAMSVLNRAGIPYALLPGNHDLGEKGKTTTRDTFMNDYFKAADYQNSVKYGLFEEGKMENSWHAISTPTGKFLLLALEFGPRDAVLEWANKVTEQHPDHKVIVVTHAYLQNEGERDDWSKGESFSGRGGNPKHYGYAKQGDVNDGEDMWRKFISRHPNIVMVLNGHVCGRGVSYRSDPGKEGQKIHQMLANFQDSGHKSGAGVVQPGRGYGGGGYLRLMRFYPDGKTVEIKTYSPWYDHWLKEPDHQFKIEL